VPFRRTTSMHVRTDLSGASRTTHALTHLGMMSTRGLPPFGGTQSTPATCLVWLSNRLATRHDQALGTRAASHAALAVAVEAQSHRQMLTEERGDDKRLRRIPLCVKTRACVQRYRRFWRVREVTDPKCWLWG
jgi:hypothetical protein